MGVLGRWSVRAERLGGERRGRSSRRWRKLRRLRMPAAAPPARPGGGGAGDTGTGGTPGSGGSIGGSLGGASGGSIGGSAAGSLGGTAGSGGTGGPATVQPWPSSTAVVAVDSTNQFSSNLSDLVYEPSAGGTSDVLWGVQNDPSILYCLLWGGRRGRR